MVWQTIMCVLAALGLVLLLWLIFGAFVLPLRPKRGRVVLLWKAEGNAAALQRQYEAFAWLRESSLGPAELILWDAGLTPDARQLAQTWAGMDPRIVLAERGTTIEELLQAD